MKENFKQIAINHPSDVDYKDFIKIYKKCTRGPYSFWLMIQLYH